MSAALNPEPAMVEFLLEHGANPEATDNDGATPLDLAIAANNQATARVLREHATGT